MTTPIPPLRQAQVFCVNPCALSGGALLWRCQRQAARWRVTSRHGVTMTVVQSCTCVHEFQDARYGRGMRVKNEMKGGKVRCTICRLESGK